MMNNDGSSVIVLVERLKKGDPEAARQIWERYSQRMMQLARARLRHRPQPGFDEEDVTLSAFDAFCRAMQKGQYFNDDRHNLWGLLATFTIRKLNDQLRSEGAAKRQGDVPLSDAAGDGQRLILDAIPAPIDGPLSNAILADEYARLFGRLKDSKLEQVAVLKLEGYNNSEIADRLGYTRRTIQRMLNLIRMLWQDEKT